MSKKKPVLPGARAGRAQTNIFVRLVGCALLVYVNYSMVCSEDFITGGRWDALKIALSAVLALFSVGIIALTAAEFVKNLRRGAYAPSFYSGNAPEDMVNNVSSATGDPADDEQIGK